MYLTRSFNDLITLWSTTGLDGYSVRTYAEPELVHGRWEDLQQITIMATQEQLKNRGSVYLPLQENVNVDDYLALGDFTLYSDVYAQDPKSLDNAFIVVNVRKILTPRGRIGVQQILFNEARL